MIVRRIVASLGATAVVGLLPVVPSYADGPTDLYVATADHGGDDAHDCTPDEPCATLSRAIDLAADSGTTIHVSSGTFDGVVDPGPKSVSIDGDSTAGTVLTATAEGFDVIDVGSGTVTLSELTVSAGLIADVAVYGTGTLHGDHLDLTGSAGCGLAVLAGSADLTDSVVEAAGTGRCGAEAGDDVGGQVALRSGSVMLTGSRVLDPADGRGVTVQDGTFTADQTYFDDNLSISGGSPAIEVSGGAVTVRRSTVQGWDAALRNDGGAVLLSDSTVADTLGGIDAASGSTTVVRSTFVGNVGSLQGTVAVAGSVFGKDHVKNCLGTITDLGYNLSADHSCGFTSGTSRQDVTDLHLDTDVVDRGGPVPTVATFWPSPAVDLIPAGATYGDAVTPLCPAAGASDLRGVPRPVAGACDAGSTEIARTTTTVQAPARRRPHHEVDIDATVGVPDVGVEGLGDPVGTVTVRLDGRDVCQGAAPEVSCTLAGLPAGRFHVTAVFTPSEGNPLHPSASLRSTILVGRSPSLDAPRRVVLYTGRLASVRIRAHGAPQPYLRLVKGHLPDGLRFQRRPGRATITGKPARSAVGTRSVRVRAGNLMGVTSQRITLVIRPR